MGEIEVKIYRLRHKRFELNNFSGQTEKVLDGSFVSIEHDIHFSGFPPGDVVTLSRISEEIKIVYPTGNKAYSASLKALETKAVKGDWVKLQVSAGTFSPLLWINGERAWSRVQGIREITVADVLDKTKAAVLKKYENVLSLLPDEQREDVLVKLVLKELSEQ